MFHQLLKRLVGYAASGNCEFAKTAADAVGVDAKPPLLLNLKVIVSSPVSLLMRVDAHVLDEVLGDLLGLLLEAI